MSAWQLFSGFLLVPPLLHALNRLFHSGKQVGFAVLARPLPALFFFWGMHCSMLCVDPDTAHTTVLALDLIASSCILWCCASLHNSRIALRRRTEVRCGHIRGNGSTV